MIRRNKAALWGRKGSVLLMTLVIIGLISTLTISFAGSMVTQLQVSRDQTAAMHAELSAQSGLEYAERQLLLDPLWQGTNDDPLMFTEGSAFLVERLAGKQSKIFPTEVKLEVDGMQSAARSRFRVHLRVDPGDPLLDKALSVLGDTKGSNLQILGDYLILDAPGWLWDFRHDLVGAIQAEENAKVAPVGMNTTVSWLEQHVALDKRSATALDKEQSLGMNADGTPNRQFLASLNLADRELLKALYKKWVNDAKAQLDTALGNPIQDLLLHVRKEDTQVQGVWARTDARQANLISLSRIDSPDTFHNFSEQLYAWALNQEQSDKPVHAPGWDMDSYLIPNPNVQIFEHVTDIHDVEINETVVILLDPGAELHLENVIFHAGLVIWCEKDFDVSGPPRNTVSLAGDNSVGGNNLNLSNEALYAPGCAFTVLGSGRHSLTGFSLIHSLQQVHRLHHNGVLIILNSADGVFDSTFTYERSVALRPPSSVVFFGNLPAVQVDLQLECFEIPLQP